jgi:hypothetical protein
MRTWRSTLRTQHTLALRVALLACAIPLGLVAVFGDGLTVPGIVGTALVLAAVFVAVIGRFAGG